MDKTPTFRFSTAIRFLLPLVFAVLWGGGDAVAQPATDIESTVCAAVTLLEGESTVNGSSPEQRPLETNEILYAGSVLQTGGGSKMELTFSDNSIVRLNGDSSIELGIDDRNEEKQTWRFQVKLLKGNIWVTLPEQPEDRGSPQILAVGALLEGEKCSFRVTLYQDGAAEMKVYSGYVTASGPFVYKKEVSRFLLQPAGDDEMRVTDPWRYRIEPYRKIIIQASGKETKPFRFAARADMSEWVQWNQQRDANIR